MKLTHSCWIDLSEEKACGKVPDRVEITKFLKADRYQLGTAPEACALTAWSRHSTLRETQAGCP